MMLLHQLEGELLSTDFAEKPMRKGKDGDNQGAMRCE
jgi:hypothetical protein